MKKLDCLFVYPGAPAGKKNLLPIMPAGLLAMAAYLAKRAVNSAIISLPTALKGEFYLPGIIKDRQVKLVCIPAHWHRQAAGALALAARLKRAAPGVKIALGGYTASYFAAEILAEHPAVDFVVRGDGELPLLKLIDRLKAGGAGLAGVPNLAWRGKKGLVLNRVSYAASSPMLTDLGLAGLGFVLNRNPAPRRGVCFEDGMFTYVQARGCADNCSACGGGREFHRKFCGRRGVALKSAASAARDFAGLAAMGIKEIQLPLSPLSSDVYYIELLRQLMKRKLEPVLKVELCGLPSAEFLHCFSRAPGAGSKITIFSGSGSERVRRLNRGRFYTNAELMQTMRLAARLNVNVWTTFTTGLPFETRCDLQETGELIRGMRREFGMNRASVYAFSLEPGSPLFETPEKYGVKLRRRALADFLDQRGKYDMGYATEHFTEKEIVRNLKFLEKIARG